MLGRTRGIAVAVMAVTAALVVTRLTWPLLRPTPTAVFYAAVMAGAWLGGAWGGAAAVGLSAAAGYFAFLPPYWEAGEGVKAPHVMATFVAVAAALAWLIVELGRSAAREREQRLWLAGTLSSIGDAVIATDAGGRVTFLNGVAEALTGWSAREARGRPLAEVFAIYREGTRERAECPAARAMASGTIVGLANHTVLVTRGGGEVPIEDSAAPIVDDRGRLRGAILVFRDATESRRAQITLEEEWRGATNVVESISEGFLALDAEFRHTYVNGAAERINGIPREELIGKTHWEAFPGTLGTPVEANFRRAATGRETVEFENHYEPWGRWYAVKASPARDGGIVVYFRDVTEAKCAAGEVAEARALAERQARDFDATLSAVRDLVFTLDRDGRFLYANRALLDLWGVPAGGGIGKTMDELGYPEDARTQVLANLRLVFEGRRPVSDETPYRSPSGAAGWYEYTLAPVFDESGAVVRVAGSSRDVSARREAEGRLRLLVEAGRVLGSSLDAEATLAAACDLVVPGFADWCALDLLDEEGAPRRVRVAHKDPGAIELVRELRRRYPPNPDDPGGLMKVLRTGEPEFVSEITDEMLSQAAKDPEHLALIRRLGLRSVMMVPLVARGRTLGALTLAMAESSRRFGEDDLELAIELASRAAMAVDNARLFAEAHGAIRARDEAVGLHRTLEERLTLLVEASGSLTRSLEPESVLGAVLDLTGRLVRADAYAVWRYRPEARHWIIEHASGLSADYRATSYRIETESPSMPESPILAEDVAGVPILDRRAEGLAREGVRSLMSVPLRIHGQVSGSLTFYYRRPHRFDEIEVRIATALANLAGSAIGSSELYQEIREAGRRKDEFLAMLAHELRNPLAAIGNAVTLSARGAARDDGWAMGVVARQSRHLTRLIDDLLDVSRINRGKIELRKEVLDLAPLLDSAVATVRPLAEERGHAIEVDVGRGLWADVDPTRLEQVVVNLLNNAAKYSEDGGLIRLTARVDGAEVLVSVADRGVGIAPERLPEMFELFSQGDRSLARSEGGLGIGLTVVKKLVESHGGRIEGRSEGPGKGSEFTIRLPLAVPPPATEADGLATSSRGRGSARILVVDDNVDTARTMARILESSGHAVAVAHGGPEALEAARGHDPEFVLLDIGLPGMDGYEVAARLRREAGCARSVIVAVTGYGQDGDRRRSEASGIDHHLVKPVDPDALFAILDGRPD